MAINSTTLLAEEFTSVGTVTAFPAGANGQGFSLQNPQNVVKTLPQVAGWKIAISCSLAPPVGVAQEILRLEDLTPTTILQVFRQPTGKLRVVGPFGAVTDTVVTVPDSTLVFFDIGFFQSAVVGRIEVRYGGSRIASLTSTAYTNTVAGTFVSTNMGVLVPAQFRLVNAGQPITYDYIGVQQDTAAWADTPTEVWTGVALKGASTPTGNGNYASAAVWQNVGGGGSVTDLYLPIDELPSDHDTSYNVHAGTPSGSTPDRMSVTMSNKPSAMGTIKWVCHKQEVRTSPGGVTGKFKIGLDTSGIGGSLVDSPEFTADTSQAWKYFQHNPDFAYGTTAWTPALFNAAESTTLATSLV